MEHFATHRGFTLIEMLIVLAIIGAVIAVVLTGQSGFNRSVLVSNTAYDVAITLRKAEVYGISSGQGNSSFLAGSGIDFNSARTTTFRLFSDTNPAASIAGQLCFPIPVAQQAGSGQPNAKPGDCIYQAPPPVSNDYDLNTYTLGNGITIANVCAKRVSPFATYCWTGGSIVAAQIDVTFARPNTAAIIVASDGTYASAKAGYQANNAVRGLDAACIKLKGPGANPVYRYIYVNSLGQITASVDKNIQADTCL